MFMCFMLRRFRDESLDERAKRWRCNFISAQVVIHSSSRANTGAVSGSLIAEDVGVPYGSRTRVAAVKEKRPIVIQWNLAHSESVS
jgi:hypothetical protein